MENPTIPALGTILGVWAHPDDEAYLSAATMALARAARRRVAVLTATAGEQGAPPGWSGRRTARTRRRELAAALGAVGVVEHHVAGVPDGRCAEVPLAEGAALVGRWIRYVQPDTILTFGPDGLTGHPDHRAVSAWATAAWEATGRAARLLHATVTPAFHERWAIDNERLGLWETGQPPVTPESELGLRVECTGSLLERKVAALRAHASQVGGAIEVMGTARWEQWFATEAFADASSVARTSTAGRRPAPILVGAA